MSVSEESSVSITASITEKSETLENKAHDHENDDNVDKTEPTPQTPQLEAPPPSLADPQTEETSAGATAQTTQPETPPPSLADPPTEETTDVQNIPEVPPPSLEDAADAPPSSEENKPVSDTSLQEVVPSHSDVQKLESIEQIGSAHSLPEPSPLSAQQVNSMASDMIYDIIKETLSGVDPNQQPAQSGQDNLYVELSEHDQLTAFIEDTLGALADDISMGERKYIPHDEAYFWMTYFFLQFCGFRIFLANIDDAISRGEKIQDMAQIIAELVDNVADNAAYLHSDSDLPEHVAKNIIWQILNSSKMLRRYNDKGVSVWQVEDILDEILGKVVETSQPPKLAPQKSTKIRDKPILEPQIYEEPEICQEFGGIFNVAEHLVAKIIDKSKNVVHNYESKSKLETLKDDLKRSELFQSDGSIPTAAAIKHPPARPLQYPKIEEFTIRTGTRVLQNMVSAWKTTYFEEDWACSIKFLLGQSDSCSDYYIYEAKLGLPTPLYPVPQATCSLLFTIEVSRVKPPVCSVNISYKIEGSGCAHDPHDYIIQESWLLNVIDAKLKLFSKVNF